ncbi:MAG TPA: BON domain-containing protein [Casimicrobiaceae bacterium]|nr:BON domain-containing protein [Casimicrobiaceae bacterium]
MNTRTSMLVALAATALLVGGCDRPSTSTSQKLDQSAPKTADATPAPKSADATPSSGSAMSGSNMSAAAGDTAITAKVKAALIAEPGLKSMDINVETKDGTVTLSGNVASPDLREKAKQVASSTAGVKGVIDNLNIKTTS